MINEYGALGGMSTGRGKMKYSEKTCPSKEWNMLNDLALSTA
jgi:hypothetical protein